MDTNPRRTSRVRNGLKIRVSAVRLRPWAQRTASDEPTSPLRGQVIPIGAQAGLLQVAAEVQALRLGYLQATPREQWGAFEAAMVADARDHQAALDMAGLS